MARGDHAAARTRLRDGMVLFTELANGWGIATSLNHLGHIALAGCEHRQAEEYFAQSLNWSHAEDDREGAARALAGLASVAVADRDLRRAAYLFGSAEALAETSGIRMDPVALSLYRQDVAAVRGRLGDESVRRAWERGRDTPARHGGRGVVPLPK